MVPSASDLNRIPFVLDFNRVPFSKDYTWLPFVGTVIRIPLAAGPIGILCSMILIKQTHVASCLKGYIRNLLAADGRQ
eukprot:1014756-Pyramimonas_sp.AAC.1